MASFGCRGHCAPGTHGTQGRLVSAAARQLARAASPAAAEGALPRLGRKVVPAAAALI